MTKRKLCFGIASIFATSLSGGLISVPVLAEGPVDISIVELVDDGSGGYKPWEDITGAIPGMTYSAIPRVRNDGTVSTDVRMCLSESAVNAAGDSIALPANTFGINIGSGWNLDNEGVANITDPASGNCYKYSGELAVGDVTEPLFTEVMLSSVLGNEYKNSTFSLHLEAYAGKDIPDDPVAPDDQNSVAPDGPDTGKYTNSEPLTTAGYITLSLGAVILVGMMIYLVSKSVRKK